MNRAITMLVLAGCGASPVPVVDNTTAPTVPAEYARLFTSSTQRFAGRVTSTMDGTPEPDRAVSLLCSVNAVENTALGMTARLECIDDPGGWRTYDITGLYISAPTGLYRYDIRDPAPTTLAEEHRMKRLVRDDPRHCVLERRRVHDRVYSTTLCFVDGAIVGARSSAQSEHFADEIILGEVP